MPQKGWGTHHGIKNYRGWDKILMITPVSSQKSPTPNISGTSVKDFHLAQHTTENQVTENSKTVICFSKVIHLLVNRLCNPSRGG